MTIFDRSWYGRVLVERVENFATEVQWRRAYQEITDFEHSLAEEGMIVIKLWMHMSHEEQLRRFVRRRDDPLKAWKLTDEDWRNREKRPQYDDAVSDMLRLTQRSAGALGRYLFGEQAQWAGRSHRDGDPPHGGRDGALERPVQPRDEERTELALSFDDAEFQHDPGRPGSNGAAGTGDPAGAAGAAEAPSRRHEPSSSEPVARGFRRPVRASRSPSTGSRSTWTVSGSPGCGSSGYTDLWSAEVDGSDGFMPRMALAAALEPELNLGVAITPAYTRGPGALAQSLASMADAAPGRFFCGLGASSQVICGRLERPGLREPVPACSGTPGASCAWPSAATKSPRISRRSESRGSGWRGFPSNCRLCTWRPCGPGCCTWRGGRPTGPSSTGSVPTMSPHPWRRSRRRPGGPPRRYRFAGPSLTATRTTAPSPAPSGRRMITAYLNVHAYAEFHRWLGPGPALQPMWDAWAAGDRKGGARWQSPTRWSTTSWCTGRSWSAGPPYPEICRQRDHGPGPCGDPDRSRPRRRRSGSVAVGRVAERICAATRTGSVSSDFSITQALNGDSEGPVGQNYGCARRWSSTRVRHPAVGSARCSSAPIAR